MTESEHHSEEAAGLELKEDKSIKMSLTCKSMRASFPSVKQMQTSELHHLIRNPQTKDAVVVLDVRPDEEFRVSHIEKSVRVDPSTKNLPAVVQSIKAILGTSALSETPRVVAYCSLGYRSSDLISRLSQYCAKSSEPEIQQLTSNIQMFNLEGSLFKWANESRPMVDSNNDVTAVCHPFNAIWGKILRKEFRAKVE